jgi:hypothetical protein
MSQSKRILNYLKKGNKITPLSALNKFGCFRLSGRVFELRRAGHKIATIPTKSRGKVFASYKLIKAA